MDNDARLLEALALLREHGNIKRAATAAGIPRHTLSNRIAQAVARGLTGTLPPGAPQSDVEMRRLRDQIGALKGRLTAVQRESIDAADVRQAIFNLSRVPEEPPVWLERGPTGHGIAGVPVTVWSDWHIGETVRPEEVNGVNRFNLEVAKARINRLVEKTIDLCFSHMTNAKYPGVVVALLGDMVTGEIHDELAQTNDTDLLPAVLWTRDILIAALTRMADAFGNVFVPCAPGNHGRNTKRVQAKRFAAKNFDWLIYCMLERYFKEIGDSRVRIYAPETGEPLFRVYGHRLLGIHGHDIGVKGGDGIIGAIGPITRGTLKVANSQAQIGRDFDTLLMGHWHQMLWLPRVIVANSLKGYDEYARAFLRAGFSLPSQPLFFVHPKHGITARWEVLLEDRPAATGGEWISWKGAA